MAKQQTQFLIPHERTIVASLYSDSGLPFAVGSTIVCSLAPPVFTLPHAHPDMTTFVKSPAFLDHKPMTAKTWRLIWHAETPSLVDKDLASIRATMVIIARKKNLYLDRYRDKRGHLRDDDREQQAAEAILRQMRSWSRRFTVGELTKKAAGDYFQKTPEYLYLDLVDILRAQEGRQTQPVEGPWECPACQHELAAPPRDRICPACGLAVPRDEEEGRWRREKKPPEGDKPPEPYDSRWLELDYVQERFGQHDPQLARTIECIKEAAKQAEPGEAFETLSRIAGRHPRTLRKDLSKLKRLLRS